MSILLLVACQHATDLSTDTSTPPTYEDGGSELPDLQVEALLAFSLQGAPLAPAALVASWDPTAQLQSLEVEVDAGDGQPYSLPVEVDAGRRVLVGFKPQASVSVRLVATRDGQSGATAWQTLDTAPLPPDLPALIVDTAEPGALDGGVLMVTQVQNPPAILAVDGDGDIVWWRIMDDSAWLSRARPSQDGLGVVTFTGLDTMGNTPELRRFGWDGELIATFPIEGGHHDFTELPDGTLAVIVTDSREVDGAIVDGDSVVEVSPDGTQVSRWSTWDEVAYEEGIDHLEGSDWTHANALSYDPETDSYLLTLLGLSTVMCVDAVTGQTRWVLGGKYSDFVNELGRSDFFSVMHGVDLQEDTLLVFENSHSNQTTSRVAGYRLDTTGRSATEDWSWAPSPPVTTITLGDVARLEGGSTVANFATAGRITEVMPDGTIRWQISTSLGDVLGYSHYMAELR